MFLLTFTPDFTAILALLGYVSRAHEIEIRPSLAFYGIDSLWSYCMDFFQVLVLASPGPYAQTFVLIFEKKWGTFYEYFSFLITWDPMEYCFWIFFFFFFDLKIFEILCLRFFTLFFVFVNLGPMGAKTSKRYSSLKSLLNPFKLFLKFLLSGPDKSSVLDF